MHSYTRRSPSVWVTMLHYFSDLVYPPIRCPHHITVRQPGAPTLPVTRTTQPERSNALVRRRLPADVRTHSGPGIDRWPVGWAGQMVVLHVTARCTDDMALSNRTLNKQLALWPYSATDGYFRERVIKRTTVSGSQLFLLERVASRCSLLGVS